MTSQPAPVRHARAADLRRIADVEASGGVLFEEAFGDLSGDPLLAEPPSGGERLDRPGFLLVVGPVGEPVGFAHVEVVDSSPVLAQLSVRPEAGRRGLGTALVRAAVREAWWEGFDTLSLTTYRDLAWNGPFYRRLGFVEVERPEPHLRRIRDHERAIGLDRHGARVVMQVAVRRQVTDG